ncbi:MAG: N-acetyl-gamma-glutamyl-phosphate reductase [Alkalispirochaeta sp.]
MRATVLGASGYGGMLLLRLLAHHPEVTRVTAAARTTAGTRVTEADPGLPHSLVRQGSLDPTVLSPEEALTDPGDIVFSALPHGASAEVCAPVLGSTPVIDLSADFRFADSRRCERAYGPPAPAPEIQSRSVYGLCEWMRDQIPGAAVIANPGCYPTASLLPVLPAAAAGLIEGPLVINAISGTSGGGRTPKQNLLFAERNENANAYGVGTQHRHQAEIVEQLLSVTHTNGGDPVVLFNPHLAPIKQGMAVTTVVPTSRPAAVVEALQERYHREHFIELMGETAPETRHVRGSNRIRIGWRVEREHVILLSAIDNLWKGASGQAVQNMNIYFGFSEETGLDYGMEL